MALKSQLSSIMPVAEACGILGEARVTKIVTSLVDLTQQQQTPSPAASVLLEDTAFLVRAMFYTVNTQSPKRNGSGSFYSNDNTKSPLGEQKEEVTSRSSFSSAASAPFQYFEEMNNNLHCDLGTPPSIREAWNLLSTRKFMLDKLTMIKFLVPPGAQPHPGAGGHMGLFDCLAYALQTKSTAATSWTGPPLVGIPDIVIFLAICKQYRDLQGGAASEIQPDHPAITRMSKWMFVVYDSYQKKNLLQRDTIHRFLSDVYGEDCYKEYSMKRLLGDIFMPLSPTLTSRDFCQGVAKTISLTPTPTHFLLDWMANLAHALMPVPPQEDGKEEECESTTKNTAAYLKMIDQQVRWLEQILDDYDLAEHRLYEVKRRYHSLVESSNAVIQGDPMNVEETTSSNNTSSATTTTTPVNGTAIPKQTIPLSVFEKAVCSPSDELGHGGYLPLDICEKVFSTGMSQSKGSNQSGYWELAQVLKFGGMCVRVVDDDKSIVLWILQMISGTVGTKSLTKPMVGELLKLICNHQEFRHNMDRWYGDDQTEDSDAEDENDVDDTAAEETTVPLQSAKALGLVPKSWKEDNAPNATIPLQILVDHMLDEVGSTDGTVTLEQILKWHRVKKNKKGGKGARKRLGPFIMELRLMASVLFGIPPKLASLEDCIVAEIKRRHEARYPQTELSRRGPSGTVWYIIDYNWYQTWYSVVQKISFTPEDGQDFRDKSGETTSPRRLSKISNKGLLRDNGSLALRVDIKWRSEYEILPPLAWSALQAWYDGGPPIYRTVVPYIPSTSSPRPNVMKTEHEIELYPFFVTMFMCDATSRGEARPFQQGVPVSRVNPVRQLLVQVCKGLDIDPGMGRLWVMDTSASNTEDAPNKKGGGDWLLNLDANIADQRRLKDGDHTGHSNISLLLELKDEETGLWPRGMDGKQWSFSKNDAIPVESGDGIVGLYNMGNTCYMNSSIQCLSHTPVFKDYFNMKYYLNDINTTNPLGYEGRLAQVSAVLINSLWKRFNQQAPHQPKRVTAPGSYAPVNAPALTPKTFKESIGKFNDIFAGNEQHDAQEFLAFLLGGLSEDLNRIQDKPYIEAPDSDGRPDHELADIWWSNHLQREMSIVVAFFTGQYKSLLKCKLCKYESARFEPFSVLQIPLPEDDTIPVSLIVYPVKENVEAMKYSVRVHNSGTLYDVLISLAKVMYADEHGESETAEVEDSAENSTNVAEEELKEEYANRAKNMAVVDMREGYIFKIAPNSWRLPDLQNKDSGELPLLHVYALDPTPEEQSKELSEPASADDDTSDEDTAPAVSFLALAQRRSELVAHNVLHPFRHSVFGTPLLLRVPHLDSLTGREMYDFVANRLRNFVPSGVLSFLEGAEAPISGGTAQAGDDNSKIERRQNLQKTLSDMEEVSAGPVPRYGFRLRLASRDGRRCSLCPWYDCCMGCLIPDDESPTVVMNGDSIVIDWHFEVDIATNGFGTRGAQAEPRKQRFRPRVPGVSVKNHKSCSTSSKDGHSGAITLEDCLDAFAKEEKIPDVSLMYGFARQR
eukprot:scaffold2649_cov137-Cylindrotheca_fusiformis.AAC.1